MALLMRPHIFQTKYLTIYLPNWNFENSKYPLIIYQYHFRPEIAYIQRDTVNLPALKQTVSNKAMERKKRTQILQKARLKKEVMP